MAPRPTRVRLVSEEIDCDDVQIIRLAGKEIIGRPFWFDVEIVTTNVSALDPPAMVGAVCSLVFEHEAVPGGEPLKELRRIHGMIAEIDDPLDSEPDHRTFRFRLVPRVHRATLIETQEIFLEKTIPEIITDKLSRVGLEGDDIALRLLGTYPKRDLVVQYKETDLAFISRLSEHLGISIHFEHDGGADRIVFSDHNSLLRPIEGDEAAVFRPRGERCDVFRISGKSRMIPAMYAAQDYNYLTPLVDVVGSHELADGYAGGVIEYGPNAFTPEEAKAFAQRRAEERRATQHVFTGESDVCRLRAGATFRLVDHPRLDATELLLTEVEHEAHQVAMMHGSDGGERGYRNTFRAIEKSVPYRPERRTPKPTIAGLVHARVEPPTSGEPGRYSEIDELGRYTVRFFFDTSPLGVRKLSSLPVRMIQAHSGPQYGSHFPLKPGVEVLVAFSEGDPDRPFIVGSVPNPITPSPVTRQNAIMNRIESVTGVFLEMKDI